MMKKSSKTEVASSVQESTGHSGNKETAKNTEKPKTRKRNSSIIKKIKLSQKQKQRYIDMLITLRAEFTDQIAFHRDDALSSKKDSAGERIGMATHMADLATDNFRHDIELGLLSDEGDVVLMIDEALQRLENNEFGVCLECGCEINPERLEAKPYARYCTSCKSKMEAEEDPFRRSR